MNQRKFINLLNLYLDGEIEQTEAAELEREILSNPERRRIYSEYCRIQRATKLVYDQFRLAADGQVDTGVRTVQQSMHVAPGGNRVAGLEAGRPFRRVLWWTSGAVAACAAVAFSLHLFHATPTPAVATSPAIEPAVVVAADTKQPEIKKPETIAAPFAPFSRIDPYIAEQPRVRSDPFALVSWPTDSRTTRLEPTPAELPTLRLDLPSTTLDLADPTMDRDARREQRVFRSHNDSQPVSFEPTGYQIRR